MSGLLPTGTVTLLLADVEGSTRLWETQAEVMTVAIARLNRLYVMSSPPMTARARSNRVRVTVLWRRSRARPMRWPLRWSCSGRRWPRSGCGSGCIPVRCSCAMRVTTPVRRSTARRVARSGPRRPNRAVGGDRSARSSTGSRRRLADRSGHPPAAGSAPPERVVQLCHPDLVNEFPPLRTPKSVAFD